MKIIITAVGSTGDVYPFLALGALLRQQAGHQVLVIANERFRARAEAAGLVFVPHGTIEEYERSITPPPGNLKNPFVLLKGASNLMEYNFFKPIGPTFDAIAAHAGSNVLLIGHGVSFGARLARDAFRLPMISGIMSPTAVPGRKNYGFGALMQRIGGAACTGRINRFCAARGLPGIKRVDGWSLSPDGVAALFPPFFDARYASWPAGVTAVGYQRFDPDDGLEPATADFLRREPAVLFTSGTPIRTARALFSEAVEVCRRLGRRGLFVTDYPAQLPSGPPPFVRHVPYVSFRRAFPLCVAVVHHGGIGTSLEALAAGVPQFVTPLIADQPSNAARLKALGVAGILPLRRFTAGAAAPALRALIENNAVRASCRELKEKMERDDAAGRALALVEKFIRTHFRKEQ